MVRLFVAVELDDAVRGAIDRTARELGRRLARHGAPEPRWVASQNRHLTIRFIGEIGPDRAGRVHDALIPPLPLSPFEARFDHVGVFPPRGSPRVLWIGVGQGRGALAGLFDEIERRLLAVGEPPEPRPFAAHLTLARFRERPSGRASGNLRGALDMPLEIPALAVSAVTLFESRLSPTGPRYEARLRVALSL